MAEVVLDLAAQKDISEAAQFYETQKTDLGKRFLLSVENGLRWLERHPLLYRLIHKTYRRCLLKKFPYEIIFVYTNMNDQVYVVAAMHQRQSPNAWQSRTIST